MDIRRIIFDNWSVKLLSFGFALTLWFYVTSTGKTELTVTVPIELRNIPQGMTVVGNVAGTLEVRMQGRQPVLSDGNIGNKVVALLDLSMTTQGENLVRISPDDIKRPAGIAVSHLSRYEIKVKLEPLIQKAFRLKPVLHGPPAAGYRMINTIVTPQRITIEGPASVIKAIQKLETMPIDIQRATQTMTVEPRIDYQGQPVKLMEKNIMVRVHIERAGK